MPNRKSLKTLAEEYVRSRADRTRPVSIGTALHEIRAFTSAAKYTDDEIVMIVAEKLIEHGHAIDFDVSASGAKWRDPLNSD
jgi:hypothetical protein